MRLEEYPIEDDDEAKRQIETIRREMMRAWDRERSIDAVKEVIRQFDHFSLDCIQYGMSEAVEHGNLDPDVESRVNEWISEEIEIRDDGWESVRSREETDDLIESWVEDHDAQKKITHSDHTGELIIDLKEMMIEMTYNEEETTHEIHHRSIEREMSEEVGDALIIRDRSIEIHLGWNDHPILHMRQTTN